MKSLRPFFAIPLRFLRAHSWLFSLLLVGMIAPAAAQAPAQQTPPAAKSALTASAMDDLPARLDAVHAAQQGGDVAAIAAANRNLIAVALRAMAELEDGGSLVGLAQVEVGAGQGMATKALLCNSREWVSDSVAR